MQFTCYYWNPESISTPELRQSLVRLIAGDSSDEERQSAFAALLGSTDPVAQGIALDNYFYANSLTRYGGPNPFENFAPDVLSVARKELASESIQRSDRDGRIIIGSNYASALGALFLLGDLSDVNRIAAVLESSEDINVLAMASLALGRFLKFADADPLLIARLTELAAGTHWPQDLRIFAIQALRAVQSSEVLDSLTEIAKKAELPYSAYAAEVLAERDIARYREFLVNLTETWPQDAPYPAFDLRRLLKEGPGTDAGAIG